MFGFSWCVEVEKSTTTSERNFVYQRLPTWQFNEILIVDLHLWVWQKFSRMGFFKVLSAIARTFRVLLYLHYSVILCAHISIGRHHCNADKFETLSRQIRALCAYTGWLINNMSALSFKMVNRKLLKKILVLLFTAPCIFVSRTQSNLDDRAFIHWSWISNLELGLYADGRTSDSRTFHTAVSTQSLKTFLVGYWDQSAVWISPIIAL